ATTEIYTLSLHDALPIYDLAVVAEGEHDVAAGAGRRGRREVLVARLGPGREAPEEGRADRERHRAREARVPRVGAHAAHGHEGARLAGLGVVRSVGARVARGRRNRSIGRPRRPLDVVGEWCA